MIEAPLPQLANKRKNMVLVVAICIYVGMSLLGLFCLMTAGPKEGRGQNYAQRPN